MSHTIWVADPKKDVRQNVLDFLQTFVEKDLFNIMQRLRDKDSDLERILNDLTDVGSEFYDMGCNGVAGVQAEIDEEQQ